MFLIKATTTGAKVLGSAVACVCWHCLSPTTHAPTLLASQPAQSEERTERQSVLVSTSQPASQPAKDHAQAFLLSCLPFLCHAQLSFTIHHIKYFIYPLSSRLLTRRDSASHRTPPPPPPPGPARPAPPPEEDCRKYPTPP